MRIIKVCLPLAGIVGILSVAAAVWWFVVRLDSHLATANQSLSDSADLLDARMEAESTRYAGLLTSQSAAWRTLADRQASEYRRTLERETAALRGQVVYAQVMDVRPTLQATRQTLGRVDALARDARDSWDDLYFDVKASVESSTMAARGIAEASEATGKAMPRIAASAEIVASEAAKAAPDARRTVANVERMTRPASWLSRAVRFVAKIFF